MRDDIRPPDVRFVESLESAVPHFFGLETPQAVAEAIHTKRLPMSRLSELAPVVFAEATHDDVAGSRGQRESRRAVPRD